MQSSLKMAEKDQGAKASVPMVVCLPDPASSKEFGGDMWVVRKQIGLIFGRDLQYTAKVHIGYLVDRSALPFTLRWFLPLWGDKCKAAIVYQFLRETPTVTKEWADGIKGAPHRLTRKEIHEAVMGVVDAGPKLSGWKRFAIALDLTIRGLRTRYYESSVSAAKTLAEIRNEQIINKALRKTK